MPEIYGNTYGGPKNVNLRGGILRFGVTHSSNPLSLDTSGPGLYINSSNQLVYWDGSSTTTLGSAGSMVTYTLNDGYDDGATITVDNGAVTLNGVNQDTATLALNADAASSGPIVLFTNSGSGNDITGTSSLWSVSAAGAGTFASVVAESVTAAANLTLDATGAGTIGIGATSSGAITLGAGGGSVTITNGLTISGTADANKLTITAGDMLMSNGKIAVTNDDTDTALAITAAAVTTGSVVLVTANGVTSGAIFKTTTTASGFTGAHFLADEDASTVFSVGLKGATTIAGSAAGTVALQLTLGDLVLEDSDTSKIESEDGTGTMLTLDNKAGVIASDNAVLLIDAGGAVASGGNLLRVAPTGTPNAGAIAIEYVGASKTCQAMYIDGDSTGVDVVHVQGGGALTDGFAVLGLTNDGNLATGGALLNITMGGTPHTAARAFEIDARKDAIAVYIDSDAATQSAVQITGSGVVADNKAMLHVSNDAAIAAGSSLVRIESSANAAGATAYGLEIACNGTNLEGLYVSQGTSLFVEAVTFTAGQQSSAVARTATATGETTGTIAAGTTYVDVTGGSSANDIIILPSPVTGNVVWLGPAATGYELRSSAPQTVAINGGVQTAAESAIAANVLARCVCTSATTWVCSQFTAAGTESPVQVAAT